MIKEVINMNLIFIRYCELFILTVGLKSIFHMFTCSIVSQDVIADLNSSFIKSTAAQLFCLPLDQIGSCTLFIYFHFFCLISCN